MGGLLALHLARLYPERVSALVVMGVPLRRVVHRVQAARDERYASLRGYFHGAGDASDDPEHLYVRLHSVILRDDAGAVGKRVEFLLQEIQRELNTTGSKVADVVVNGLVVDGKGEVEKLREQVQNIE
jgi:CPA2 family monovalent cation:H+ antiporter-2